MGGFKPLLPIGSMSALERCINLFVSSGISDTIVVTGYRSDDLTSLIGDLNVRSTVNEQFRDGMLSSIQSGIRSLEASCRAFFLLPVDIPLVGRSTILHLLKAYDRHDADIIYPCFQGRRGHPPLINTRLNDRILAWNEEGGLNALLRLHQESSINVEVDDENILLDMDTWDQYRELCRKAEFSDSSR